MGADVNSAILNLRLGWVGGTTPSGAHAPQEHWPRLEPSRESSVASLNARFDQGSGDSAWTAPRFRALDRGDEIRSVSCSRILSTHERIVTITILEFVCSEWGYAAFDGDE